MDTNWIEASLCFPTFPRFCGQTFPRRTTRSSRLLCVQAYNDWMVDEWCGDSGGRLIPLMPRPAVGRRRWPPPRCAATPAAACTRCASARSRRSSACRRSTTRDNYWDPFFAACDETETVINMHIGSWSKMPSTSADAPPAVGSTLTFANACYSLVDWLM